MYNTTKRRGVPKGYSWEVKQPATTPPPPPSSSSSSSSSSVDISSAATTTTATTKKKSSTTYRPKSPPQHTSANNDIGLLNQNISDNNVNDATLKKKRVKSKPAFLQQHQQQTVTENQDVNNKPSESIQVTPDAPQIVKAHRKPIKLAKKVNSSSSPPIQTSPPNSQSPPSEVIEPTMERKKKPIKLAKKVTINSTPTEVAFESSQVNHSSVDTNNNIKSTEFETGSTKFYKKPQSSKFIAPQLSSTNPAVVGLTTAPVQTKQPRNGTTKKSSSTDESLSFFKKQSRFKKDPITNKVNNLIEDQHLPVTEATPVVIQEVKPTNPISPPVQQPTPVATVTVTPTTDATNSNTKPIITRKVTPNFKSKPVTQYDSPTTTPNPTSTYEPSKKTSFNEPKQQLQQKTYDKLQQKSYSEKPQQQTKPIIPEVVKPEPPIVITADHINVYGGPPEIKSYIPSAPVEPTEPVTVREGSRINYGSKPSSAPTNVFKSTEPVKLFKQINEPVQINKSQSSNTNNSKPANAFSALSTSPCSSASSSPGVSPPSSPRSKKKAEENPSNSSSKKKKSKDKKKKLKQQQQKQQQKDKEYHKKMKQESQKKKKEQPSAESWNPYATSKGPINNLPNDYGMEYRRRVHENIDETDIPYHGMGFTCDHYHGHGLYYDDSDDDDDDEDDYYYYGDDDSDYDGDDDNDENEDEDEDVLDIDEETMVITTPGAKLKLGRRD